VARKVDFTTEDSTTEARKADITAEPEAATSHVKPYAKMFQLPFHTVIKMI